MALDLSKRRDRPRLGEGKVPQEVKQRINEDWRGPENTAVVRVRAKARRVIRTQGRTAFRAEIVSGMRAVGGPWEDPSSWVPSGYSQKRAYQEYLDRLNLEEMEGESAHPAG